MLYISSSWIKLPDFINGIETLSNITRNIELSGGARYSEKMYDELEKIRSRLNLNFLVHGFFPPSKDSNFLLNLSDCSQRTREFITQSMNYIYAFNIPYLSLHSGFKRSYEVLNNGILNPSDNFSFNDMFKNMNWILDTFPEKKLAVENLYPVSKNVDCAFCMDPKEITELMEADNRIYLLLDLGHLKVSGKYLNFDYIKTANELFRKYKDRILEIHLSENDGIVDGHFPVLSNSWQYNIISENAETIKQHNINLVIESRNSSYEELKESYFLIYKLFN